MIRAISGAKHAVRCSCHIPEPGVLSELSEALPEALPEAHQCHNGCQRDAQRLVRDCGVEFFVASSEGDHPCSAAGLMASSERNHPCRAAAQKQASWLEAQLNAAQSSNDYGSDTKAQGSAV